MSTTVITFGTFDIVHPGHIYFLQQAKAYGDRLITIIARDQNVLKFKGRLPQHKENQRLQDIQKLGIADSVELGHESDYFAAIKKYKPDIVALGYDQTNLIHQLSEFLFKHSNKYKTVVVTIDGFETDKNKSSIIKRNVI